jgi:hypothetical protein
VGSPDNSEVVQSLEERGHLVPVDVEGHHPGSCHVPGLGTAIEWQ